MAKVLLINPNYYDQIFSKSKARAALSRGVISLSLACVAGELVKKHEVKVLDLNLENLSGLNLLRAIRDFNADMVGITSTTPLISDVYRIATLIKNVNSKTMVVAGGPHPTVLAEEVLNESAIDCVVRGEGDLILNMIAEKGISQDIPNILYKKNGEFISSKNQSDFINNLDELEFPAYQLFNIKRYAQPKISSRMSPVCYIETSRGCFGRCVFCNKHIHGSKLRMKSVNRVVDEMERALSLGFREIQIIDDIFTADMNRAFQICEEILRRGLKFPWYTRGGIRVDRVNLDLLKIMKRSGCYRIPFGIESGSQRVIDQVKKHITLEQAERAVGLAKKAGLETECYFMLGLPSENEEDIKKTIDFAIRLNPDYVKFAITIPLPGTEMFNNMLLRKQIKSMDWSKYNFSSSVKDIYDHDTLSWETIDRYYNISHRRFYFRFNYITRAIYNSVRRKTFLAHTKAFFKTRW